MRHPRSKPASINATAVSLIIGLLLIATSLHAETFYKWQDASGSWVYGEHPPNGVATIVVKTNSSTSSSPSPIEANIANQEPATGNTKGGAEEQTELSETIKKVPKAKRDAYCQKGRENLEALSSKAVIRQRDAEGNVSLLSEEDRKKELDKAKLAVEQYC